MSIPTTTASPWPSKAAYFSAAVFIGASGATNVLYGWQKGTDLPTSVVWAGVAGAVAVIFALSWPALIRSLEAKRRSAALFSLLALALAGSYSVTAALGSASGGRTNAATQETAVTDVRTKAQAAYDAAKAELATLKAARPVAELEAMRAGWLRAYPRQPWVLEPELARSKRRTDLEAKVEREATKLASTGPARVANSDAKTLARYVAAIGFEVTADRLNDLLVLLAVLMIEAGGGLSLAIGMALSAPAGDVEPRATGHRAPDSHERDPLKVPIHAVGAASRTQSHQVASAPNIPALTSAPTVRCRAPARSCSTVLELIRENGGSMRTTTRRLGAQLGRPAATVHTELRRLAGAGLITLNSDSRGTHVGLVQAGQAEMTGQREH